MKPFFSALSEATASRPRARARTRRAGRRRAAPPMIELTTLALSDAASAVCERTTVTSNCTEGTHARAHVCVCARRLVDDARPRRRGSRPLSHLASHFALQHSFARCVPVLRRRRCALRLRAAGACVVGKEGGMLGAWARRWRCPTPPRAPAAVGLMNPGRKAMVRVTEGCIFLRAALVRALIKAASWPQGAA